ncbi:MAG: MBL fold metallo-hydrolase [Pseudohongiellaceae bacterium]
MKRLQNSKTVLALLTILIMPAPLSAQDFDEVEILTHHVKDNIYYLEGSGGNIGVIIGDDGVLIVDNQFAPLTNKIEAAITDLTKLPVTFVVNSHFHYDHTDGNENFGKAGAFIVAQDNARRRMESAQVLASGYSQRRYEKVGLPKITFFDAMRFYFNDEPIHITYNGPGHTDGDAQVYFLQSNVIHTGDMFVRYVLPFIDQNNGGSLDGMIEATDRLASQINDETIIIPGHGQLSTRDDLLSYREMLVTIRGNLLRAKVQDLSPSEMLEIEPADGFAPAGDGTDQWLLRAYDEYR